ncbi:hypothetical protein niasHS_012950 [Heterodera schachtii]|uniref:C-type lectin domain-containing protein n=1 Tax=Heterodera schachtii TaxID=97005 RepID=A0ABD2IP78_HETSC
MFNLLFSIPTFLFAFLVTKNVKSQQLCDNFGWTNIGGQCFRPFIYFVDNGQAKQLCAKVGGDTISFIEEAPPEFAHLVADELRVVHELRLGMPGKKNGVLCKKPANNGQNNELFDKICPNMATKWPIARKDQQPISPPMVAQPIIKLRDQLGQPGESGLRVREGQARETAADQSDRLGELDGKTELGQIAASGSLVKSARRQNEFEVRAEEGQKARQNAEAFANAAATDRHGSALNGRNGKSGGRTHSNSYHSSSDENGGHRRRNGGNSRSDTSVVVQIGLPFGGNVASPAAGGHSNGKALSDSSASSAAHSAASNRGKAVESSKAFRSTDFETDEADQLSVNEGPIGRPSPRVSTLSGKQRSEYAEAEGSLSSSAASLANYEKRSSAIALEEGLNEAESSADVRETAENENGATRAHFSASSSEYMHKIRHISVDERSMKE